MIGRLFAWAFVGLLLISSALIGDLRQTLVVLCCAGGALALGAALMRMGLRNLGASRAMLAIREKRILKALADHGDEPANWSVLDTELRVCQHRMRRADNAAFVLPAMPVLLALGVLAAADPLYAVPWSHVLIGVAATGVCVVTFMRKGPVASAIVVAVIAAVLVVGG